MGGGERGGVKEGKREGGEEVRGRRVGGKD